jgi:hypothetical protein
MQLGRVDLTRCRQRLIGGGEHQITRAFTRQRDGVQRRAAQNFRDGNTHAFPPRTKTPCEPK